MGLFSRKKTEQPQRSLPEFPKFPDALAKQEVPRQDTGLPRYEPSFRPSAPVPLQQSRTPSPLEIPQRQPAFLRQDPLAREKESVPERGGAGFFRPVERTQETIWKPPVQLPVEEPSEQPVMRPSAQPVVEGRLPRPEVARIEDKPVFVKLQEYREVMASIELLKQKIQDVEFVLGKIEELRAQEQVELNNCQNNLNKIKEKLIGIDKKLFEV